MAGIAGQRVESYRQMTEEELEAEGWDEYLSHTPPNVFELENGVLLYPSRDSEGNGPGAWTNVPNDIEGQTIVRVAPVSEASLTRIGWTPLAPIRETVTAIVFDGVSGGVAPKMDPEGNGPGEIFGLDGEEAFMLHAQDPDEERTSLFD